MRKVDLRERLDQVSPKYMHAPQPMYVCHSTKEFKELNKNKDYILVSGLDQFNDFIKGKGLYGRREFVVVTDMNVWFATNEKYIPDTVGKDGTVILELDEKGRHKVTDNCYIRLYVIYPLHSKFLLFTSSGMFQVSITKWELTAGVKESFSKVYSIAGRTSYEEKLRKVLSPRRTVVPDMRLANLLLNPLSDCFLKVDKAVQRVYPFIKKADRDKVIETERFKKLIAKEIVKLMPELKDAVKTKSSATRVAGWLDAVAQQAVDNPEISIEDKLTAIDAVARVGYSESVIAPIETVYQGGGQQLLPQAGAAQNTLLNAYDDEADKPKAEKDPERTEQPEEPDEDFANLDISHKAYKNASEKVGSISGYVEEDDEPDNNEEV